MLVNEGILCKIICGEEFNSKLQILNWTVSDDVSVIVNGTCEVTRLTVEYKKKNKLFRKYFILKIPWTHPTCSAVNKYKCFDKELLTYTTILEEMYKIDGERIGPRFYYIDDKNSLVLKDLIQSGYKTADRIEQLDFHHCSLALKYLAKFHALSVKLEKTSGINPILKELPWVKLREPDDSIKEVIGYAYDRFLDNLDTALRQKYNEKLLNLRNIVLDNAKDEVDPGNFKFHVLNHGDCWTGNILFKYNKYGMAEKIKFVDFQGICWTSPAYDIWRFTISSMKFEVYENHFDLLLEIYLTTLNQVLNFLECETLELEDLKKDLKNMNNYALLLFSSSLPKYLSSFEDPLDMKNVIKNDVFDLSGLNRYFEDEMFLELSKKWFLHFASKGTFD